MLTRALESMLFQVATLDGISVVGAVATLAAVSMLAHYFPARRALRVDPASALRQD
jgi:ABC-type lipoprotein release transport system permease subunit